MPNTPSALDARKQRVKLWHRLHHLNAIRFVFQALVDLDERNHAAIPERCGVGFPSTWPSIVRSNRIAPITFSPVKTRAT